MYFVFCFSLTTLNSLNWCLYLQIYKYLLDKIVWVIAVKFVSETPSFTLVYAEYWKKIETICGTRNDAVVFPTFSDRFFGWDLDDEIYTISNEYESSFMVSDSALASFYVQIYNFRSNNETKLRILVSLKEKGDGNETTTT